MSAKKIGEIIETSTTSYVGQAYAYDSVPSFGSFVETSADGEPVTGVVIEVLTATLDPSRRPMALGTPESSLSETLKEHPQLSRLIQTYFKVRITHVAGVDTVPGRPPQLHEGVNSCSTAAAKKLLGSFGYLASLLDTSDDVLAKHLAYIGTIDEQALGAASQRMSVLLKDDYQRLQRVLRKAG